MKLFLTVFLFLYSFSAFANETVNLKADMIFNRCDSQGCKIPFTFGKAIQIELKTPDNSTTMPGGNYKFNLTQDGIVFEGTIHMMKTTIRSKSKYLLSVSVSSMDPKDNGLRKFKFLGGLNLENLNQLNQVYWNGEELSAGNSITVQPVILVGPADAN